MIFERKSPKLIRISRAIVRFSNFLLIRTKNPSRLASIDKSVKSILLIETDRIGDAVWCIPIINCLLENFDDVDVQILTSKNGGKNIFKTFFPDIVCTEIQIPWQNSKTLHVRTWISFIKMLTTMKRKSSFDAIFELRGDLRTLFFAKFFLSYRYLVSNSDAQQTKLLTHCYPLRRRDVHMSEFKATCVHSFFSLPALKIHPANVDFKLSAFENIILNPGASSRCRCLTKDEFEIIYDYSKANKITLSVLQPPDWLEELINFNDYNVSILKVDLIEFRYIFPRNDTLFVGMDTGSSHFVASLEQECLIIHRYQENAQQIAPLGNRVKFVGANHNEFNFLQHV